MKYLGKSIRKGKTNTGKIMSGVGFSGNVRGVTDKKGIICNIERLEYLREELRGERISTEELIELQSLVDYIDPSDVELLEAVGVPERGAGDDYPVTEYAKNKSTNQAIVNGEI